jgi:hypothetical protein
MPERIFGLPMWAAIATLAGAGVVGYLIFFRNSSQSSGGGTTGYSQQALAVMQNPDESATMAEQNRLLSELGIDVSSGFSSIGTSMNSISGQVGQGFAGVHDQVAGNTYMNYYQAAYYYGLQQQQAASDRGDSSGASGWQSWADQFKAAISQGQAQGYGVMPTVNAPNYYGQPQAAA